jgi:hypothetical protein
LIACKQMNYAKKKVFLSLTYNIEVYSEGGVGVGGGE